MDAERWTAIHQIDAVTDQPQCGMTHGGSHPTYLAIAPLAEAELQPCCGDAETRPDRRIALRERLPVFGGKEFCLCRSCALLLDHHSISEGIQLGETRNPLHLHPVGAPVAEAWIRQALLQATICSQHQQPFAVGVKTTCCIDIGNVYPVSQASPAAAGFRCELTQDPIGLVKQNCQECSPKQISSASPQLEASLM